MCKKALVKATIGEKNMANVNTVVKETLHACGTWNGDVLQSFDWEALSEVAKALNNYLKAHKEQIKETAKKEKEEKKAELAVGGKAYYNSLRVGAEFSYKSADGIAAVRSVLLQLHGVCDLPPQVHHHRHRHRRSHRVGRPCAHCRGRHHSHGHSGQHSG